MRLILYLLFAGRSPPLKMRLRPRGRGGGGGGGGHPNVALALLLLVASVATPPAAQALSLGQEEARAAEEKALAAADGVDDAVFLGERDF